MLMWNINVELIDEHDLVHMELKCWPVMSLFPTVLQYTELLNLNSPLRTKFAFSFSFFFPGNLLNLPFLIIRTPAKFTLLIRTAPFSSEKR